jgi:hypothetical protein
MIFANCDVKPAVGMQIRKDKDSPWVTILQVVGTSIRISHEPIYQDHFGWEIHLKEAPEWQVNLDWPWVGRKAVWSSETTRTVQSVIVEPSGRWIAFWEYTPDRFLRYTEQGTFVANMVQWFDGLSMPKFEPPTALDPIRDLRDKWMALWSEVEEHLKGHHDG